MVLNKLVAFIYSVVGVKRIRWGDEGGAGHGHVQGGGAETAESSTCSVCLSSMEEGEERRVLPCMHEFHRGCVDRWVSSCRKNCPICRFSMAAMGEQDTSHFHRREAFTDEMLIWFSSFHIAGF